MVFSSENTHAPTRHLHQQQTLGFCTFVQAQSIRNWSIITNSVILKCQWFYFLYLVLQPETEIPEKLLLLSCIYRYTFSFTLKLTNAPHQKLVTFYMFNEKQDDGMDQKTLSCCYGDDVTKNQ